MAIPRIRTIREAAEYFAEQDPGSYITGPWLRKQVQLGRIPHFKSGNRVLLNLDEVVRMLADPQLMSQPKTEAEVKTMQRHKFGRID